MFLSHAWVLLYYDFHVTRKAAIGREVVPTDNEEGGGGGAQLPQLLHFYHHTQAGLWRPPLHVLFIVIPGIVGVPRDLLRSSTSLRLGTSKQTSGMREFGFSIHQNPHRISGSDQHACTSSACIHVARSYDALFLSTTTSTVLYEFQAP